MHCTVYCTVHCTVQGTVQCTVYSVQGTVQCTVYCTVCNSQRTETLGYARGMLGGAHGGLAESPHDHLPGKSPISSMD